VIFFGKSLGAEVGLNHPLIDCHCHLQHSSFAEDRDDMLERARQAGVRALLCNATSEKDWEEVAGLAARHPEVIPCFGIHPWYLAGRSDDWRARLVAILEKHPNACVGEIGLDRWKPDRDEKEQEKVFRAQLEVARDLERPAMIHCLKAWGWLLDVLGQYRLTRPFLLHAYGGPPELIEPLSGMGAFFSFAGNVLDEKKEKMRRSLVAMPADRLLLETDSPDLAPPRQYLAHFKTGESGWVRNEPANLGRIVPKVAELRGEDVEKLAHAVWENAEQLLGRTV